GVAEAVSGGVTTLGDCTDSGAALDGMAALGVRGVVYQEAFGIEDSVSVTQTVLDLDAKVRALTGRSDPNLHTIGVSPHSVYTVRPELMRAMATYAATNDLPVCIHAAESQAEVELVLRGTGEIADHFARRGIEWDTPRSSVVSYLDALGALGPRTLLVHGVNVSSRDRETIRSAGSAWAHCPRSNAKLGLGGAPLRWMTSRRDAGATGALPVAGRTPALRAGLGSDSVAGVNAMDMFEEMRFALLLQRALRREPDRPTAREMVRLVTIGGAEALGLGGTVGALVPGMQADIAVLSLRPARYHPVHDVWGAVALSGSARDVVFTTVAGQAVYDSRRGAGATIERAQRRVRHAAELLRVGAA
ncbi:MAG: amidohydrolase family protein, partial [Armatimonadetes bacterium]|nr:amidohydrolase family protein [Armatimonadota bacterium]